MAYMSQEKKAKINKELKKIVPSSWKWSLGVNHYSTIVFTVFSAPVDLLADYEAHDRERYERNGYKEPYSTLTHASPNPYYLENQFSGDNLSIMSRIKDALNVGNLDLSDIQTDYFDVGWYVDINLGRWDRPFKVA